MMGFPGLLLGSSCRRGQEGPGGARRSQEEPGGARRSQEETGGARRSQEEPGGRRPGGAPGGARRSQERPGGARRGQEEPGEARRSQEEPGGARRSQKDSLDPPWLLPVLPGSSLLACLLACLLAPPPFSFVEKTPAVICRKNPREKTHLSVLGWFWGGSGAVLGWFLRLHLGRFWGGSCACNWVGSGVVKPRHSP
jgi:hypothetical protein